MFPFIVERHIYKYMKTIIYELNKNGIPFYIGKSPNPKTRLNAHRKNFGNDLIMNHIDEVSTEEWEYWEKYWIHQYKCWGFELKNKTHGGNGQSFCSEDTKQKISKKIKGRISPSRGRKMSEEEKQKRSLARLGKPSPNKGKKFTDEQKLNLKKPKSVPSHRKGKSVSDEHKNNISLGKIGTTRIQTKTRKDAGKRRK